MYLMDGKNLYLNIISQLHENPQSKVTMIIKWIFLEASFRI